MKKLLLLVVMFMSVSSLMAQAKRVGDKVKVKPQIPMVVLGDVEKKKADFLKLQNAKSKTQNPQEAKKTAAPATEVNF